MIYQFRNQMKINSDGSGQVGDSKMQLQINNNKQPVQTYYPTDTL